MKIQIQYFAMLAEKRGLRDEWLNVETPDLAALYDTLAKRHGFPLTRASIRPAVNDALCAWNYPVRDGDRVVFVPPVSGG
ncbi:MAG TPA: MoaD/ThiS family protein [Polyangia bacterium]